VGKAVKKKDTVQPEGKRLIGLIVITVAVIVIGLFLLYQFISLWVSVGSHCDSISEGTWCI
jgi:hypothetical protein